MIGRNRSISRKENQLPASFLRREFLECLFGCGSKKLKRASEVASFEGLIVLLLAAEPRDQQLAVETDGQ